MAQESFHQVRLSLTYASNLCRNARKEYSHCSWVLCLLFLKEQSRCTPHRELVALFPTLEKGALRHFPQTRAPSCWEALASAFRSETLPWRLLPLPLPACSGSDLMGYALMQAPFVVCLREKHPPLFFYPPSFP